MDEKLLLSLGLNHKEIKVFRAVLRAGELSPSELGRTVGIKRTTCYSLARGLAEKGFLIENATKRPRTFSVAGAADIESVLKHERARLAEREKALKRFSAELSRASAEERYPVPQIRFVGEEKIARHLEEEKWSESALKGDRTWWGFQDHTYVEQFLPSIDKYWKKHKKNVTLKLLSNAGAEQIEKKLKWRYPERQIKEWKKATHFLSSIWVVGEYVVILNTRRRPFYMYEIHDEVLANDLREVFKNLWPLV